MNQQDNFSGQAQYYAKFRPVYPDEMYHFIFKHLNQKQYAWDCGTGSGQVAGYLADHFKTVYANDISLEQLKHAVKKNNIVYANHPAEETGYPSDYFDLITVAQAIHWFDFDKFYEEALRVAKKGSCIAVIGYGLMRTDREIDPIIENLYKFAFGKYFSSTRRYIDEEYKTIPFPFEEMPSPGFSIKKHWVVSELEGFFNSWSPIQKFRTEHGYNPVDDVMKKIRAKVPEDRILQGLFPVFLRLGRVNKTEES